MGTLGGARLVDEGPQQQPTNVDGFEMIEVLKRRHRHLHHPGRRISLAMRAGKTVAEARFPRS